MKPSWQQGSAEDLLDKQLSQHSGRALRTVAFDWYCGYGFGQLNRDCLIECTRCQFVETHLKTRGVVSQP